ncbi:hypothetical protein [Methylocaldum szegediense]|uniref:Uncharacterized protein n=1 Tax=Methylocaldum szegediense TaxID=73780 RepID=A0ABN8WYV7_9GAMM|nr:hypothetical protein [Methylocaldum szegediense]CAI8768221.1 conserved exported protein of unknown function [Methylocaldum szegediense]
MKTLLTFASALFFAIAVSPSAYATPCAGNQGGFTLICRGGFQIQNHGGINTSRKDITFVRSPNAAGSSGRTLAPGTCAWEDRPVSRDEPAHFYYSVSTTNAGTQGWFNLVSQCTFNNRCTVEVCVRNDGAGNLQVLTSHAIVRFPF